jgi:hypothetical protein
MAQAVTVLGGTWIVVDKVACHALGHGPSELTNAGWLVGCANSDRAYELAVRTVRGAVVWRLR